MTDTHRYCVVMCGGIGSRFWPFSRREKPKQFLDFFGTGRSLLQQTVDRISALIPPERIIAVTNADYASMVREQLPELPESNILCEPARRNTAPCVCWAAHHIAAADSEASIVTLPSDHLVLKEIAFIKALEEGFDFVESGDRLLTLGITPTSPHTGYGYIQLGKPAAEGVSIRKVKSFTEKPDLDMARFMVDTGEFFWNAGIFLWTAKSILRAFENHAPEMASLFNSGNSLYGTPEEAGFIASAFPSANAISVDYAIMEKASNVFVEPVDLGWSDLGSWAALYQTSPRDDNGNVTQNCKVLAPDCHDSVFAVSGDKIVVASGLDGYVVADNGNALLIYPIKDEQQIRHLVNEVKTSFGDGYV